MMVRLDAHQHFWRLRRGDYDWLTPDQARLYRDFEPDDLRPLLDAAGISSTILVQAAPTAEETTFLLSLAAAYPWIAGVVGWCDLSAANAPARVAALAARPKLVGLRPMLQDLPDRQWVLRPDVAPGLQAMADEGLVFDALIRPDQLTSIVTLAQRLPALKIVIDHGAKPDLSRAPCAAWAAGMTQAAACPNVHVKLSGLLTEAPPNAGVATLKPFVDLILSAFGARRVLWGSDWPVLLTAGDYLAWYAMADELLLGLSPEDRASVGGGAAATLYGVTP